MLNIDVRELLRETYLLAHQSPDPSTQNGAVILNKDGKVIGCGWNRLATGILDTPERWERPLKYDVVEHAERNSIYDAARKGYSTEGGTMICSWAACPDCARGIIECGITQLISHKQTYDRSPEHWKGKIDLAFSMLREANVGLVLWDGIVGTVHQVRHSGELWNP